MLSISGEALREVGVYAIDPDLHYSSLVGLSYSGQVVAVQQTDVPRQLKGPAAVVALWEALCEDFDDLGVIGSPIDRYLLLEDQVGYKGGRNVGSLILLAKAAGLAQAAASYELRPTVTKYAAPQTWKGNVPKSAHQPKIIKQSGLPATKRGLNYKIDWPSPHEWASELPASRQSHIVDALGLALWGLRNLKKFNQLLPLEYPT